MNFHLAIPLILALTVTAAAQDLKPLPLIEQCPALASDAPGDDAIAKQVAALADPNPAGRAEAARALGGSCRKSAVEPLIDLIKDSDMDVRVAAIESLGRLGDDDSVQFLADLIFADRQPRLLLALIRCLASFKTFKAKNWVVNGIANPNGADISDVDDMRVRCIAILTMNTLKDVSHSRKSILFLNPLLNSSHASTRELAEKTMYALKETRNGPTELIALVKQSNDPHLRKWTIEWIGKLKIEKARDLLEATAASDNDPQVRAAATEALKSVESKK